MNGGLEEKSGVSKERIVVIWSRFRYYIEIRNLEKEAGMKKSFHSERREPRQESVMDVFGVHRRVEQAAMPFVAAALPVLAAAAAVDVAAGAVAKAVRTWRNYRPPRWKLLKCPKPEAVEAQWELLRAHRDLIEALRFGGMLLNISQYVDCSAIYGRGKHIVARNPGLKGWLRENCREINYVTAMSYRKLAQTTCQAIGLPEFLPLEWVMPGTEAQDATREINPEHKAGMKLKRKEFLRQIQTCREKLTRLLEGAGNVNRLNAVLDVATQGHRYRVRVKITDADSKAAAERSLDRHLRTALETLQALPPDQAIAQQAALLALLDDLKRQVESRCA